MPAELAAAGGGGHLEAWLCLPRAAAWQQSPLASPAQLCQGRAFVCLAGGTRAAANQLAQRRTPARRTRSQVEVEEAGGIVTVVGWVSKATVNSGRTAGGGWLAASSLACVGSGWHG